MFLKLLHMKQAIPWVYIISPLIMQAVIKTSEYNSGPGTGEIGWAPIMGVGYYQNLTSWNNGPNSYGCTNYQNDLDVITDVINGFTYRTDDHADNFAGQPPSVHL